MIKLAAHDLVRLARQAGYHVQTIEQLRPNRWLLTLIEPSDAQVILLVQARPLISSSDVHELTELVRARHQQRGILLAYAGAFTFDAQRTVGAVADVRLCLCTTLPQAATKVCHTPAGQARGGRCGGNGATDAEPAEHSPRRS